MTVSGSPLAWVRMTLGGNGESGRGQTRSPSSSTSYGVIEPGARPVTGTTAKWRLPAQNERATPPRTVTSHGRSTSTQTVASVCPA